MRERRNNSGRRAGAGRGGSPGAVAAVGLRLWTKAAHRPVDAMAILCASAASLIIVVNAVFLQSGSHPAPFFANPTVLPQPAGNRLNAPIQTASNPPAPNSPMTRPLDRAVEMAPARVPLAARTPAAASARRGNDPIGDLIGSSIGSSSTSSLGSSTRIAAVQRVLSEFGYGQLRLSGTLDEPTSAAIQKFESEHKLPVTGRLSDRLLNELAAMTGHPIP